MKNQKSFDDRNLPIGNITLDRSEEIDRLMEPRVNEVLRNLTVKPERKLNLIQIIFILTPISMLIWGIIIYLILKP